MGTAGLAPVVRPYPGLGRQAAPVIQELITHLEAAGVRVLSARVCSQVGVVVTADVTVWCYRLLLHWRWDGRDLTWPSADPPGAVRRLVQAVQGGPGACEAVHEG
jgi:hypothetical protein